MKVKGIVDEDFINYKKAAMYIAFPKCDFKCDRENGVQLCQNCHLARQPDIEISISKVVERYLSNPITESVVIAGLEPFDTPEQLLSLIKAFRVHTSEPIAIYTGYTEEELESGHFYNDDYESNRTLWETIKDYGVIVKFGRFRPNQEKHYDEVLGVYLISDNQYAKEYQQKKFDF